MRERVVVTGLGVISACGIGWKPYWSAWSRGISAIRPIAGIDLKGFYSPLAGVVENFNPKEFIPNRKSIKLMSREIQLAVAASHLAVRDCGISPEAINPDRSGVVLGAGVINNDLSEIGVGIRGGLDENGNFSMKKFGKTGIRSLYPLWMLKYLPNMPACHVAIAHQFKGPCNTMTTSAAASTQAIGEAFRIIQRGDADMMLAGGTDSKINAMGISRFHLLGLLARADSSDDYVPFGDGASGVVLGEGAGILVLESLSSAKRRGVPIYAEITGYGSSSDQNTDPRKQPDGLGKVIALEKALSDAGRGAGDIDGIIANGSGIPWEDESELRALETVWGNKASAVSVTSLKPVMGHLVYGAGGVEGAGAAIAIKEKGLPGTFHPSIRAPKSSLNFLCRESKLDHPHRILFNSFGFGGQNAALIFEEVVL